MSSGFDHERFVKKNRALAKAYKMDEKDKNLDKKGFSRLKRKDEASCSNCKHKSKCTKYRQMRSGGMSGVVSVGGDEKFICDRYEPMPAASQRSMSNKQINSLLKNVKKGY